MNIYGKFYWPSPAELTGHNLIDAHAAVITTSSYDNIWIQLYNYTLSHDILTSPISIDQGENTSYTSASQPVINTSYDHVATADMCRLDIDGAGTGAAGLWLILTYQKP